MSYSTRKNRIKFKSRDRHIMAITRFLMPMIIHDYSPLSIRTPNLFSLGNLPSESAKTVGIFDTHTSIVRHFSIVF